MAQERCWRYHWVSLLLLVAGVAAFCAGSVCAWNGYRRWQLPQRGVHVHARLTGKDIIHGRGGPGYRIYYQFETADERSWLGTSVVGWADRNDWQAATDTVEVAYLAEDPVVNHWVVGLTEHISSPLIAAVPLGLGACLLLGLGVKAARSPEAFWRWWAENARR